MDTANVCDHNLHLEETELRLGLPGTKDSDIAATNSRTNKRALITKDANSFSSSQKTSDQDCSPAAKTQVVGWPPVRSYRKNHLQPKKIEAEGIYVKVSMDGAPYLRKIDLNTYKGYTELLKGLEEMFKFTIGLFSGRELFNNGSEFVPTYEDKDGDWMLVGDVPWNMFISSCKRLRIMKGSEASGLASAAAV